MDLTPISDPSTVACAQRMLALRHIRADRFPDINFEDAIWGILLDLFVAAEKRKRIPLSSLIVVSGVPKTTALRAITDLVEGGHLARGQDPHDGRRNYAFLTPDMHVRLHRLIHSMSP